jgi:stearoyl-CoA desaturase (delta-9 desaturase)
MFIPLLQWLDADYKNPRSSSTEGDSDTVDWLRCLPFLALHLGCAGVYWVGWSWTALCVAAALYAVRMFAITGFYHRYFSHRSFRTSRPIQFGFAVLGASSAQRGPLWWAANHRIHHRSSDMPSDPHSPTQHGFWWSHVGWFMSTRHFPTAYERVQDLARFPELLWLNRFDSVVPVMLALGLFLIGWWLEIAWPALGVTGGQLLVWGFFVSTVLLFHGTSSINSIAHLVGSRRYETEDSSRNNFLLALLTLGEGWHNNHHQHMSCTRQGFYWWEIDLTYYALRLLEWSGLIWNLRPVPPEAYQERWQRGLSF